MPFPVSLGEGIWHDAHTQPLLRRCPTYPAKIIPSAATECAAAAKGATPGAAAAAGAAGAVSAAACRPAGPERADAAREEQPPGCRSGGAAGPRGGLPRSRGACSVAQGATGALQRTAQTRQPREHGDSRSRMEQRKAQTWEPRALPAEGRQQETFEGVSRLVRGGQSAGGELSGCGGADTAA